MNIPPPVNEQCHCQHCNINRNSPLTGDSLLHCGTQANYTNYSNPALPTHDTPAMVRSTVHSIIDRYLDKFSTDDWERLLKHYDHVSFTVSGTGWYDKPKLCKCDLTTISQQGCQCGGI